jgi:hypothetical protein
MCAGWIAPMLRFWLFAPFSPLLLAGCAASTALWWLPAGWYRIRPFEPRLYEKLGVRWFRRIVPNGDWVNAWRRRHDRLYRVVGNARTLAELRERTMVGEKSHLVLLFTGAFSALYAWTIGWNGWAAYLAVSNVLANLYPVLLQRYTRSRIRRA